MIPGSNLLALAMGPIATQTLQWQAFVSRTRTAAGDWVSTFAASADIGGSFQPVNKKLYQQLGLNLAKNYWTLYTQANVLSSDRDREGDRISYNGQLFTAESINSDWMGPDGWRSILCVGVPA